jgi:hydroxymethylbilane synthase
MRKIIIGSRGSDLALWQANHVQAQLAAEGVEAEIHVIKTRGDRIQHLSFDKMEGKGFFTKEIEDALLSKTIDLAVHSHKDLETTPPESLLIAAVSERENPSDLLLIKKASVDPNRAFSLRSEAIVGTSSARRKVQLLSVRPDIKINDLRGNVPTRIQKLRDGNYDAIMLAAAGVQRLELDLSEFHVEILDPKEFVPAPAQGVLGLQIREDDQELFEALQPLNDPEVAARIAVERKVLNLFQGGCQLPLGVFAEKRGDKFKVWASMATDSATAPKRIYAEQTGGAGLAESIVDQLNKPTPAAKTVLITRELQEDSTFRRMLEQQDYVVKAVPLIEFEAVPFEEQQSDWIFFSSRNGVRFYLDGDNMPALPSNVGAVGPATALALQEFGITPQFVGEGADTVKIGRDFAALISDAEKVLFPGSNKSRKTVQKQLKPNQVIDVVVYNTSEFSYNSIPSADILVFTSPSNASSYLDQTLINDGEQIVVMGTTTGNFLAESGITGYSLPWASTELALADSVLSL